MKTILAIGLLGLALGSCQKEKPISELSYSEIKSLAVVINQRCIDQGVKPEDPQWQTCTKQEISKENSIRNRAAAKADRGMMCQQVGALMLCD